MTIRTRLSSCLELTSLTRLLDSKELDLEVEGGSLGDSGDLLVSVSQVGRDGQLSFTTNGHADESLVPTLNDLSTTEEEREGGTTSVGVELLAVVELTDVSGVVSICLLPPSLETYRMDRRLPGLATGPVPTLASSMMRPEGSFCALA